MPELDTLMRRCAAEIQPSPNALGDVMKRAERRSRRRRLDAAVLALVLTAGLVVGLVGTLGPLVGSTRNHVGSAGNAHWDAVWPHRTSQAAADAQTAIDAGDATLRWQTRPRTVITRYARGVLGFHAIDIVEVVDARTASGGNPGWLRWAHRTGSTRILVVACGPISDEGCPAVQLDLERVVRDGPGGIWVITRVDHATVAAVVPSE